MTEAVAILGVAAAAVQCADVGGRLLLFGLSLCTKLQGASAKVEVWLDEVRQLVALVEAIAKIKTMPSLPLGLSSSETTSAAAWVEAAIKDCTLAALSVERTLEPMLQEVGDGKRERFWKKILTVKRETHIVDLLNEIERKKSILSIWFEQISLRQSLELHHSVGGLRREVEKVAQLQNIVHQNTEDIVTKMEDAKMLTLSTLWSLEKQMTKQNNDSQLGRFTSESQLHDLTREIRSMKSNLARWKSFQNRTSAYPSYLKEELDKFHSPPQRRMVVRSLKCSEKFHRSSSRTCSCHLTDWLRNWVAGSNTQIAVHYHETHQKGCPALKWDKNTYSVAIRRRIRIDILKKIIQLTFAAKTGAGGFSMSTLLRSSNIVENRTLRSFFRDWYRQLDARDEESPHSGPKRVKYEDHMIRVAYKVLRRAFDSGSASPNDVDPSGQNLIHWQINQLRWHRKNGRICARLIRLLISMGTNPDASDSHFRTPQQLLIEHLGINLLTAMGNRNFLFNQELLDWSTLSPGKDFDPVKMLNCMHRWPESVNDWGYPYISGICLRKSKIDLENFISRGMKPEEVTARRLTPLHWAAAAGWSAGVELLLASGADKFAEDSKRLFPITYAIYARCPKTVELLMPRNCRPYFVDVREQETKPHASFTSIFESILYIEDEKIRDILIRSLYSHRRLLSNLLLHHYVALARYGADSEGTVAEKLYSAGFHNLEQRDGIGKTALMLACSFDTIGFPVSLHGIRIASFLVEKGADISAHHIPSGLTAGHFLGELLNGDDIWNPEHLELLRRILLTGFDVSNTVFSMCRCSPDGFTPITASYQQNRDCWRKRKIFHQLLHILGWQKHIIEREVRAFVLGEVFDRLEMTHTCVSMRSLQSIPDEDRIEIEDEEEELNNQLEQHMRNYDSLLRGFQGEAVDFLDVFLEGLEQSLPPFHYSFSPGRDFNRHDQNVLGPGKEYHFRRYDFRGEVVLHGHKEQVKEENVLALLFGEQGLA